MPTINPYIHFNGNIEEAFNFYKSVFGGEFSLVTRFKDFPADVQAFPAEEANKILHIAFPIGNTVLMGSDVPNMMGTVNEQENRSKIFVTVDSKEEADRIYNGLSVGGHVEMPIGDSPWGAYFAMFRDKFGIEWMISFS